MHTAVRGKRAYGKVPRNRGKNQTLIASITLERGMGEAISIEGATEAEIFEAYVEGFLTPTLWLLSWKPMSSGMQ